MSGFDDAADDGPLVGSGGGSSTAYEAMPKSPARRRKETSVGFDRHVAETVQGIQDFQRRATALSRMGGAVGTKRDTADLRRQIAQELSVVANLAADVGGQLGALGAEAEAAEDAGDGGGARSPARAVVTRRRQQINKLERDFGKAKGDWEKSQSAVRRSLDEHEAPDSAAGAGGGGYLPPGAASDDPDGALRLESGQLLIAQQVEHNSVLVQERDAEIQEIAHKTAQVQATFRDLAEIVNQQQEDVDLIEDNAVSANEKTEDGRDMLVQAEQKQKSTRKCLYILLCLVLVVVGVVVFMVLGKSKK